MGAASQGLQASYLPAIAATAASSTVCTRVLHTPASSGWMTIESSGPSATLLRSCTLTAARVLTELLGKCTDGDGLAACCSPPHVLDLLRTARSNVLIWRPAVRSQF